MTDQTPRPGMPSVPRGEILATVETYPEAQSIVDRLVKAEVAVRQVSIVGSDLKTVERVTGSLSWGKAALGGAANGAFLGLFFALLLTLFTPVEEQSLAFIAAIFLVTAGVGMVMGLIVYSFTRKRRDFTSTQQVVASSYQVIVAPEVANEAKTALARTLS